MFGEDRGKRSWTMSLNLDAVKFIFLEAYVWPRVVGIPSWPIT